ncbi:MAG: ABC transporter substrate-binding protein [Candidatus Omnitrophota bacterium]
MPRKIIIMGLLMLLAFKPACVFAQDKVVLKVGLLPIIESLPLAIGATQAEVSNANMSVQIEVFSTWTGLEAAYRTGIIDIAAMTAPKVIKMANRNIPLKIIMGLHRNGDMLVTNFSQDSADSFRGTMIGVSGNDTGQLLLLAEFLKSKGLELGPDVRYIAIPQTRALDLLRTEKIQGFLLSEPYGTMAQAEGIVKTAVPGVAIRDNFIDVVLMVNPLIIKRHSKELKQLVDAIKKSGQIIEKDLKNSGGKQIAFSQFEILGIDPEIVQKSLNNSASKIRFDDMRIKQEDLENVEKQALDLGILDSAVNLADIIDNQFSR